MINYDDITKEIIKQHMLTAYIQIDLKLVFIDTEC